MTAFADIHNAVIDVLRAAPALADGEVMKNRLRPLSKSTMRAVVVRLEPHSDASESMLGALDWITAFSIECYGRSATGPEAEDAADTLLSSVFQRLSSAPLTGQHGITSTTVKPAIEWQADTTGEGMACHTLTFVVTHRTTTSTLNAWS